MPRAQEFVYVPSFDGVRCIAVAMVLAHHGGHGSFRGGWLGVDLFFVLSGFLITSLLVAEFRALGKVSLVSFYIRRALRLLPALIVCLLLTNLVWDRIAEEPSDRILATAGGLFYFANLLPGGQLGPLSHLWSLSVEEHFYFIWPAFASIALIRRWQFALPFWIIVFIVAASAYRITAPFQYWVSPMVVLDTYRITLARIDALLLGALCAVRFPSGATGLRPTVAGPFLTASFGLLSVLALLVGSEHALWRRGGFLLTNALCAAIVLLAVSLPHHPLLSHPALTWVGRRSYGIYLYHFPIFLALEPLRRHQDIASLVFVSALRLLLTLLVAAFSFRYIERPMLRLKHRYERALPASAEATPRVA